MGRSSARCASCGAAMPHDAAYCPGCGAASGALRVEPMAGALPASAAEVALGAPRRRWLVPVVIAAVAALVVAVAVVGSGSHQPSAAPTTSTVPATTAAPTTSTAAPTTAAHPSTTTTLFSTFAAAPMPDAAGVVVYEALNDGDVLRVDVGTGQIQRRFVSHGDRAAGPWAVLGRQGGFLAADGSFDQETPLYVVTDGPDGPAVPVASWTPAESDRNLAPRASAAAEPDEVWLWNEPFNGQAPVVRRVRVDGSVTAGPVALPRFGTIIGADGPGAVALQAAGGFYRATVNGQDVQIERIWPRAPVAYSSGALLDLDCDGGLACQLAVLDRTTGQSHPVPGDVIDHVVPSYDNALSADGRWLANVDYSHEPDSKLRVRDLTTGAVVMEDDIMPRGYGYLGPFQSADFSADGRWLVYFNLSGGIRLWRVGSPDPPVTFDLPGVTDVSMISIAPG